MKTPRTKLIAIGIALCAFIATPITHANSFLCGNGAPAADLGTDGDVYFNQTGGALLKKMSGTWTSLASRFAVKGDKGDRGETGQRGMAGPNGPPGPNMRTVADATARAALVPRFVPEMIVQLDNNTLWRATATTAGAFVQVPTQGATGPAGPQGPGVPLTIYQTEVSTPFTAPTDQTQFMFISNESPQSLHISFPGGNTDVEIVEANTWVFMLHFAGASAMPLAQGEL
jgi:hypothetical protein